MKYQDELHERQANPALDVTKPLERAMNTLRRNTSKDTYRRWSSAERSKLRTQKKRELQKVVNEDAPVNSAGGGAIAGIGVGVKGEPGVDKKRKRVIMDTLKRKTPC